MEKWYVIYDTKDNEIIVGMFKKAKDVAKFFNTNTNVIFSEITKKTLRDNRYRIERIII